MRVLFFLVIITLQLACSTKKEQGDHPTLAISGISKIEQPSVNNNILVDQPIIIGGYKTRYTLLTRPASYYSIIISNDRCVDFSGIEQIADMERLRIHLPETSDIDFSPLKSLSKLQYLYINGAALTGISDLGDIPSLVYLELDNNSLTSLNGLEKIPQLESLSIIRNVEPIIDMSALRHLKKLNKLQIHGGSYGIEFSDLKDLPELDYLQLSDCGEVDLSSIGQLTQVKKLQLRIAVSEKTGKQGVFRNIEEIGGMTGLEELYLNEIIRSVEFLANNVNLESLELAAGWPLPGYLEKAPLPLDVAPLRSLKKLKYFAIWGFELKNANVLLDTLPELDAIGELFSGDH